MRQELRRCAALATLLSAIGTTHLALAADTPSVEAIQQAGDEFNEGREAFDAENFAVAAERFESADRLAPNPRALAAALSARANAGYLDRAAELAVLGLERYPDDTEIGEIAGPVLDAARAELAEVLVECSEPCSILVGQRLVHGAAAAERTVFLSEGKHGVTAGFAEGQSRTLAVTATAGESQTLRFDPPKPEPAAPTGPSLDSTDDGEWGTDDEFTLQDRGPESSSSEGLSPAYFFSGMVLTSVAAGVSVWSGIDTLNNPGQERVRSECAGEGASCPTYQDGVARQRRTNVLWAVTGGLALSTAVIGAWLTDWGGTDEEAGVSRDPQRRSGAARPEQDRAAVRAWVGFADGAVVGASGRF